MSVPISYCTLMKAVRNNKWDRIHSSMRYNNNHGAFTICPCSCGKCGDFTKEEQKIVGEKLSWTHPQNQPFFKKQRVKIITRIKKLLRV